MNFKGKIINNKIVLENADFILTAKNTDVTVKNKTTNKKHTLLIDENTTLTQIVNYIKNEIL